MKTSTKELIDSIKGALGSDFSGAVHESTGPDGIVNFFDVAEFHAEKLLELAIEDEAELGRIMARQILEYLHSCCKHRNSDVDIVELEDAA